MSEALSCETDQYLVARDPTQKHTSTETYLRGSEGSSAPNKLPASRENAHTERSELSECRSPQVETALRAADTLVDDLSHQSANPSITHHITLILRTRYHIPGP